MTMDKTLNIESTIIYYQTYFNNYKWYMYDILLRSMTSIVNNINSIISVENIKLANIICLFIIN